MRPNRVLLLLWALATLALLSLPLVGVAPNRILTPLGRTFGQLVSDSAAWALLLLPLALLGALALGGWRWHAPASTLGACAAALALLAWLAGRFASQGALGLPDARFGLGGGFWALLLLWWLMAIDAAKRLTPHSVWQMVAVLLFWLPLLLVLASGATDALSLWQEYRANRDSFHAAFGEHLRIVGITLGLSAVLGLGLGIRSAFFPRFGQVCLNLLGIVQTVPSIALFGLLIAPLSALSQAWPTLAALGIRGIGMAPAVIALVAYALLPMVRATVAGLQQVPAQTLEAARGMGMSARQILWRVQLPLALPVILSGLRVMAVQTIGLTVLAALIGAGGFGALMFRGLAASALDLVLLGVVPVVLLAAASDAVFLGLTRASTRGQPGFGSLAPTLGSPA